MARDPKKHQKSKERRNRREKEKRKEHAKNGSLMSSPLSLLKSRSDVPFHFCGIHSVAFTEGMGSLVVSRILPNGLVVAVIYLVDLYCLGIKDVIIELYTKSAFEQDIHKGMFRSQPVESLTPAEAKKLVAGVVEYAKHYGLLPAADYVKSLAIFNGVDESPVEREFTFGLKGKPCYINGPHDSVAFQNRIRNTLEHSAGPGGYDFIMMLGGSLPFDGGFDDDWDDEETGDEGGEGKPRPPQWN